jgi:hypothetical protein
VIAAPPCHCERTAAISMLRVEIAWSAYGLLAMTALSFLSANTASWWIFGFPLANLPGKWWNETSEQRLVRTIERALSDV